MNVDDGPESWDPAKIAAMMQSLTGLEPGYTTRLAKAVVITCPTCSKSIADVYTSSLGFFYLGWMTPGDGRVRSERGTVGEMLTGELAPDIADLTGECRTGHGQWELDRPRVIAAAEQYIERRGHRSRPQYLTAPEVGWRLA